MHVPLYIGLWLVCLSSRVASSSLGSYTEPPYAWLLSSSCFRAASHRDHYIQSQPGYNLKACGVLCEGRYAAEALLGAGREERVISEGGRGDCYCQPRKAWGNPRSVEKSLGTYKSTVRCLLVRCLLVIMFCYFVPGDKYLGLRLSFVSFPIPSNKSLHCTIAGPAR